MATKKTAAPVKKAAPKKSVKPKNVPGYYWTYDEGSIYDAVSCNGVHLTAESALSEAIEDHKDNGYVRSEFTIYKVEVVAVKNVETATKIVD